MIPELQIGRNRYFLIGQSENEFSLVPQDSNWDWRYFAYWSYS